MFNQLKNAAASFSQNNNNNNQNQQQQQGGAAYNGQQQQQQPGVAGGVAGTGAQPQAGAGDGGGDALDKGIAFLSKKMGMKQTNAQTEKYSDMARAQYKKATGKDMPIADKEMR